MKQTNEWMNEKGDKDILFSKTVKAGKRVYYFDVKRDRRNALYLSVTESKRIKDGNPEERPVFEKHKIFLYREDMEKFMSAIAAATDYAIQNSPVPEYEGSQDDAWEENSEEYFSAADRGDHKNDVPETTNSTDRFESSELSGGKIKIDLDF